MYSSRDSDFTLSEMEKTVLQEMKKAPIDASRIVDRIREVVIEELDQYLARLKERLLLLVNNIESMSDKISPQKVEDKSPLSSSPDTTESLSSFNDKKRNCSSRMLPVVKLTDICSQEGKDINASKIKGPQSRKRIRLSSQSDEEDDEQSENKATSRSGVPEAVDKSEQSEDSDSDSSKSPVIKESRRRRKPVKQNLESASSESDFEGTSTALRPRRATVNTYRESRERRNQSRLEKGYYAEGDTSDSSF